MTAAVRIVARNRRDRLGEGLLWSARDDALYWTDILACRINRLRFSGDHVDSWQLPDTVGWIIERERGGFVAGVGHSFAEVTLDPVAVRTLAQPDPDRVGNRMNDAKADRQGRIWAGTMPLTADRPTGAFYRLDPDGGVTRVDDAYTIANGPAIAANGRSLVHTDTARATIFRFAVADDGTLHDKRPFVVFERDWGHPDGMTFDAEGGLWVACWGAGQVMRFDPDGRPDRRIALPASQITNVTFAGAGLDRLFVTSAADGVEDREPHAGALFEVDAGCCGLPTQRFAG